MGGIRIYFWSHHGEGPGFRRHESLLFATGSIRLGLGTPPGHHDRPAFRTEGNPHIDPVVVPTVDHGRDTADLNTIFSGIEVHEVKRSGSAFGIRSKMLAANSD